MFSSNYAILSDVFKEADLEAALAVIEKQDTIVNTAKNSVNGFVNFFILFIFEFSFNKYIIVNFFIIDIFKYLWWEILCIFT